MNKSKKYLLDTSIQIKRLTSKRWRSAEHDNIWKEITPVTCIYSFMEFKNTVIASLSYLYRVIKEIREIETDKDKVHIRLNDVIQQLNNETTIREGIRRVKLANTYAALLFEETSKYPRAKTVDEILMQVKCEAENLEEFGFFYVNINGKPKKMEVADHVDCYLGKNISPILVGNSKYTCKRGTFPCKITKHITYGIGNSVINAIENNKVKVKDQGLNKGAKNVKEAINEGKLLNDLNIGQRLCLAIGDCILVSKAHKIESGILTVDKDQIALAKHIQIPSLLYASKMNIITEV